MEEFFDDAREIQYGPMFAYADDRCHAVSSNAVFVIRIARTLPDTFRRAACFLRSTSSDEIAMIRVSADSCSLKTLQRFMLGMYAAKTDGIGRFVLGSTHRRSVHLKSRRSLKLSTDDAVRARRDARRGERRHELGASNPKSAVV